ncbi:MAG TPA: ABC transporter permease [Gaiellaceae bacterium]|nr:ABC transporter permease [Gaiellaceae bacterium]
MVQFLIRRIFWAFFLFFVATIITYIIFFVIPTDPAQIACGVHCVPAILKQVRHSLHLDLPIYQQYWIFVWNMVKHQSLGYSFVNGASVRWVIGQDAPVTASLVFGGAVFWLALSIPIGILSALRPRSIVDRFAMVFVLVGISAPAVWIGLILAYLIGFKLGWTPIAGYCNLLPGGAAGTCSGPAEWAYHLILPWMTFMFLFAALYVRLIRANVMETMTEDYVRTARAKGASAQRVLFQHVLRNSMLPVVTILGMDIGLALGGAVFTETVFQLRGLGSDLVQSAFKDDLPVVVGVVVFATLAVIVFNFLVDVAYAWLDPRIRLNT